MVEIKSIPTGIRPEAVQPQFTADILKARGLTAPVGQVKAQPDTGLHRKLNERSGAAPKLGAAP